MAYKTHAKKLTASQRDRKREQREKRKAKQQAAFGLEQITQAQVDEMLFAVLADMNAHILAILEVDFPEALPLSGADFYLTTKQFSDAGKVDILKNALGRCDKERETFAMVALLSLSKKNLPTEAVQP